MHRDYLYGKLSDYHFIRLHFTTIFDGITTISFWWRLKVLDSKFCHGFNSSCSGIFTFNGCNGPFQPELSERRAPCRHVTIMDLQSHILEIQLMPCHTFVMIKTRRFSFVNSNLKYPITAIACMSPRLNLYRASVDVLSLFHICIETICMENYQTITSFVFISLGFFTASLLFHFDGGPRSWIPTYVMVVTQAAVVLSHSMDSTASFNRNCLRDGHRAGMWPSWTYTVTF